VNAPTEALAKRLLRWIRLGLTVLVGYPLPSTSLSCHWTEDRPKAVRISGKSGEATGVGLPSGGKENDTLSGRPPVALGAAKER
jgi:hypothetical protein